MRYFSRSFYRSVIQIVSKARRTLYAVQMKAYTGDGCTYRRATSKKDRERIKVEQIELGFMFIEAASVISSFFHLFSERRRDLFVYRCGLGVVIDALTVVDDDDESN